MGIHGVLGQIVLMEKMIFFQHLTPLNYKITFSNLKKCVKYLLKKPPKIESWENILCRYNILSGEYIYVSDVKTLSTDKFIK